MPTQYQVQCQLHSKPGASCTLELTVARQFQQKIPIPSEQFSQIRSKIRIKIVGRCRFDMAIAVKSLCHIGKEVAKRFYTRPEHSLDRRHVGEHVEVKAVWRGTCAILEGSEGFFCPGGGEISISGVVRASVATIHFCVISL